eukprot:1292885-Amphidinium_carterae.2
MFWIWALLRYGCMSFVAHNEAKPDSSQNPVLACHRMESVSVATFEASITSKPTSTLSSEDFIAA